MIYELQITDTYYVAQYSTLTCTHEIFRKEAFTLKGTEYKTAVEWLNKFVGHGIIIDNDAKTGVRVVVANKITGKTAFLSDNYVFLDNKIYDTDLLRELFSSCLEVRISKPRNYTKMFWWLIASLMVMGLMLSFRTCKSEWDKERKHDTIMKEIDRETSRDCGIDNKEIESALKGEKVRDEELLKEQVSIPAGANCSGDKKRCRELFMKRAEQLNHDPYHDKNGKTKSIAGTGVHNFTEYKIKGDTLMIWSFDLGNTYGEWYEWIEIFQYQYFACGFTYIKGYKRTKALCDDNQKPNFIAELRKTNNYRGYNYFIFLPKSRFSEGGKDTWEKVYWK